jgi:hypothetical protein
MMQSALYEMWPQYVAGVLVLATGALVGAVARAVRQRRSAPLDRETADRREDTR